MRILLDERVPRPFLRGLPAHNVRTVPEMGWAGKTNGVLLTLMAANGFDVLVTVDQNLRHQHDPSGTQVAVIVMYALSNRLADLVPLAPAVNNALGGIQPGDVIEVRR
jgi:hypothetical protein